MPTGINGLRRCEGQRGDGVGGRVGRDGVVREGVREEREACGPSKISIPS